MSNENKPSQSTDLSKFEVYDESEQGHYEDPNAVCTELSDGRTAFQEPDGQAYIEDSDD